MTDRGGSPYDYLIKLLLIGDSGIILFFLYKKFNTILLKISY